MAPAMSAGHRALAYRIAVLASTCLGSVSCVVVVAHMREKWRARRRRIDVPGHGGGDWRHPAPVATAGDDSLVPVLRRGFAAHWPAARKWARAAFWTKELEADVRCPIATTNEEVGATRKRTTTLRAYCRALLSDDGGGDERSKRGGAYLKQLDLTGLPALMADLALRELFGARKPYLQPYLWIGPPGAVTGMHSDDEDNVLLCFRGTKTVLLVPPAARDDVYENGKYDEGTRCCDVDPSAPDLERHPRFRRAPVQVAVVAPGDALFIPRYWYHHVTTGGAASSVSVNVFASSRWEMIREGSWRAAGRFAHEQIGLWPECVCHDQRESARAGRPARGLKL